MEALIQVGNISSASDATEETNENSPPSVGVSSIISCRRVKARAIVAVTQSRSAARSVTARRRFWLARGSTRLRSLRPRT